MLITLVRTRNFAFKATGQEYHRVIRDQLFKQLKDEIRAYQEDVTQEYKFAA